MSGRTKTYGRAFPIRSADIGQYRSVARPRVKRNGMGVTALTVVNGRRSVREATRGMTRNQRLERARRELAPKGKSMRANASPGAGRARFVKLKTNGKAGAAARGKRLAAYRAAKLRGMSDKSAARSAVRRVPWSSRDRKAGSSFKGVKARRQLRRNADDGPVTVRSSGSAPTIRVVGPGSAVQRRSSAPRRAVKKTKAKGKPGRKMPRQFRKVGKKSVRTHFGPYRRVKAATPSGKRRPSYLYKTKSGALRRVPVWAIAGAKSAADYKSPRFDKARERIAARRKRAAARIERGQDAFTPNAGAKKVARKKKRTKSARKKAGRRKTSSRKKKSTRKKARRSRKVAKASSKRKRRAGKRRTAKRKSAKRVAAGKKAARTRARRKAERSAAAKRRRRGGKRKARASTKRRKSSTRRKKKTAGRRRASSARRKSTKRSRAAKRGWARRRQLAHHTSAATVRDPAFQYAANGRRRRRKSRKGMKANRRKSRKMRTNRRRMRRNGRRRMRRNGLMPLFKTGAIALGGFLSNKVLTGLALRILGGKLPGMVDATGSPTMLAVWQKPIFGTVTGVIEIFALNKLAKGKPAVRDTAVAGVVVSVLQNWLMSALLAFNKPQLVTALEGYQNSTAYGLRGTNRYRRLGNKRAMGLPERNATSIMPRYSPVGTYQQAAAGTGEYFAQAAGVGEYFANSGVEGVGAYEKAGSLALLPTRSAMGQLPIDDGIRPDGNLDNVMSLAESAAGVGSFRQAAAGTGQYRQAAAGMGEYYSSQPSNGGYSEYDVPTQDQWIPNGPLWAGTMSAGDSMAKSEIAAGILQGPGGNGVLSGG